jgi:hypothetical protein
MLSRTKQHIQQHRQSRISDVFVVPRHGPRLDLPFKAVAHHHFISFAPFLDEPWHFPEVVAAVGVAHQ